MLVRAWEAGTPVTQRELFEIKQAGERAYHGDVPQQPGAGPGAGEG